MKKALPKLRQLIYVRMEPRGDGSFYMLASESAEDSGTNGDTVGIYELVSTHKVKITTTLV